jgi:hypothetical protein
VGKRGPKPKSIISTNWTPELAYSIGLLATDGCVIPPYQIDLTSRDREQLENFCKCVGVDLRISEKKSGSGKIHLRVQFKNRLFFEFLVSVGLMPAKSRKLGVIRVPSAYFWDFLRGVYDGDGSTHAYWDLRWRSSYMIYTIFASASPRFAAWLRSEIKSRTGAPGHVTNVRGIYQLKYAKQESLLILHRMYEANSPICLSRKKLKVRRILRTIGEKI